MLTNTVSGRLSDADGLSARLKGVAVKIKRGCLVAMFLLGLCRMGNAQTSTVIAHVAVVNVVTGDIQADRTVVITGNLIASIGPNDQALLPDGARVVDARGQFIIPGLWDMHVHLGNATEAALPVLVYYGITGVRDMGSPSYATLRRWRIEALAGARIGPRIVSCGPILHSGPPYFWGVEVHSPEEGRKVVDQLAESGVDFIKVTSDIDRQTYFAIADEARKLDLPLSGHLPTNDNGVGFKVSAVEASNNGQKSLEHSQGIPFPFEEKNPNLIPTLVRNRTWVVPTLTAYWASAHVHELAESAAKDPRTKHIAPTFRQFWDGQLGDFGSKNEIRLQILKWRIEQVPELEKAGVGLLAGTDMGFPYVFPGDLIRELEVMVQAVLSPLQPLQTATVNPAKYLNKEREMGTVEPGKIADLVLLGTNPLEGIQNLRKVRAVVLNGRFLDRAKLDSILPNFQ